MVYSDFLMTTLEEAHNKLLNADQNSVYAAQQVYRSMHRIVELPQRILSVKDSAEK